MIKCEAAEECYPICDFCKYYNFNGNETGAYTGNGYCSKLRMNTDPADSCNDFHCFKAEAPGGEGGLLL